MTNRTDANQSGFSLIEVIVAMFILTAGLLPLAGVFAVGVQRMTASTPQLLAREKAREAIESVHAARDTGLVSWATIQNEPEGVFQDGPKPILAVGPDGLINTADDDEENPELPAGEFTREILITPLIKDGSVDTIHENLRELRVIVRYSVSGTWFTYVLTTYISSYS